MEECHVESDIGLLGCLPLDVGIALVGRHVTSHESIAKPPLLLGVSGDECQRGLRVDALVAVLSPSSPELQVVYPRGEGRLLEERLGADTPSQGEGGEIAPAVFLGEARGSVGAEVHSSQIAVGVCIVDAAQIGHHRCLRAPARGAVAQSLRVEHTVSLVVADSRMLVGVDTLVVVLLIGDGTHHVEVVLAEVVAVVQPVLHHVVLHPAGVVGKLRISVRLALHVGQVVVGEHRGVDGRERLVGVVVVLKAELKAIVQVVREVDLREHIAKGVEVVVARVDEPQPRYGVGVPRPFCGRILVVFVVFRAGGDQRVDDWREGVGLLYLVELCQGAGVLFLHAGNVDGGSQGDILVDVVFLVEACGDSAEVGADQRSLLIHIAKAERRARLLDAGAHAEVVVLVEGGTRHLVPPVGVVALVVLVGEFFLVKAGLVGVGCGDELVILLAVHHVQGLVAASPSYGGIQGHRGLPALSSLGGDEDDTIGATRSIDGCGRRILEHFYAVDVGWIDGADVVHELPVDNIEWAVVVDCSQTAHAHHGILARLARSR